MKIPSCMTISTARDYSRSGSVKWIETGKKQISGIKLVVSGAGAAALACLDLLVNWE